MRESAFIFSAVVSTFATRSGTVCYLSRNRLHHNPDLLGSLLIDPNPLTKIGDFSDRHRKDSLWTGLLDGG